VIEAVCKDSQHQSLDPRNSLILGFSVSHCSRNSWDFGNVASVILLLDFYIHLRDLNVPLQGINPRFITRDSDRLSSLLFASVGLLHWSRNFRGVLSLSFVARARPFLPKRNGVRRN
jgi:hypothetical protein